MMVAALGGAWSALSAVCMASFPDQSGESEWFAGCLKQVGYPCEDGEDCPPCLTAALSTNDGKLYYLTGLDEQSQQWIDDVALYGCYLFSVAVRGVPFVRGSYEYIHVDQIRRRYMSEISTCSDKYDVVVSGTLRPKTLTSGSDVPIDVFENETGETVVLETSKGEQYLSWGDAEMVAQILLDTLQTRLPVIVYGQQDCRSIIVYQIFVDAFRMLPSLCDTWNILGETYPDGISRYHSFVQNLEGDTVINGMRYARLQQGEGCIEEEGYVAALREDEDARIYIVPKGTTHEYLLYAFHAKVGDVFDNVWFGGLPKDFPNGSKVTIREITEKNGRKVFGLDIKYLLPNYDDAPIFPYYSWIDGVGLSQGPAGDWCPFDCAGDYGEVVLCAYKDGKQVYASEKSEQFGCWFNSNQRYFQEGMTWSCLVHPMDTDIDTSFYETMSVHGVTTIDDVEYQNIGNYYVRSAGNKLYVRNPFFGQAFTTPEFLLYDFGLKVGDSIMSVIANSEYSLDPIVWEWDKVVAVDTIELLNHTPARRIRYNTGHADIEYIGDANGEFFRRMSLFEPIVEASFRYLCCSVGDELLYEYSPDGCSYRDEKPNIQSLCDVWNVLFVRMGANGDEFSTEIHRLTTDTIINGKTYIQLYIEGSYGVRNEVTYRGALREDNNGNVYIVPATSDHDYLLYAFNAKVGDQLSNLWVGGAAETGGLPDGLNARVADITETSPRIFTIELEEHGQVQWIEGVGLSDSPAGSICPAILGCASSCGHHLLCAYKDGKQVYSSDMSEMFGCYYDSNEQQGDTIQLFKYSGDDPGSSTVDPVDPNQVVVILNDDQLTIREYSGKEITYFLQMNTQTNAPARLHATESSTFRESVSIRLTEDGTYRLDLTNPDWDYAIYGVFNYGKDAVPEIRQPAAALKILRNGQLLIRHGGKIFTATGVQIE